MTSMRPSRAGNFKIEINGKLFTREQLFKRAEAFHRKRARLPLARKIQLVEALNELRDDFRRLRHSHR